jgi:hypothetical protein
MKRLFILLISIILLSSCNDQLHKSNTHQSTFKGDHKYRRVVLQRPFKKFFYEPAPNIKMSLRKTPRKQFGNIFFKN